MQINTNNNHLAFKGQVWRKSSKFSKEIITSNEQDTKMLKAIIKFVNNKKHAPTSAKIVEENGKHFLEAELPHGKKIQATGDALLFTSKKRKHFIGIPHRYEFSGSPYKPLIPAPTSSEKSVQDAFRACLETFKRFLPEPEKIN